MPWPAGMEPLPVAPVELSESLPLESVNETVEVDRSEVIEIEAAPDVVLDMEID